MQTFGEYIENVSSVSCEHSRDSSGVNYNFCWPKIQELENLIIWEILFSAMFFNHVHNLLTY